jgi:hypothetical protein
LRFVTHCATFAQNSALWQRLALPKQVGQLSDAARNAPRLVYCEHIAMSASAFVGSQAVESGNAFVLALSRSAFGTV